jgi:tRNA-intron endonuclease
MATEEAEAVLEGGKVVIPSLEDADPLLQGGYGSAREDGSGSVLSPLEALYLHAEGRLKVRDGETGEELDFQSLLAKFRIVEDEVWIKYLIYRDLRSRGYVVRESMEMGVDFRLYDRGTYGEKSAKYVVYAIYEGTSTPIQKLKEALSIAQNMEKQLIVAVMDRRGETVYYSLSTQPILGAKNGWKQDNSIQKASEARQQQSD